jgi:hypothetical protein
MLNFAVRCRRYRERSIDTLHIHYNSYGFNILYILGLLNSKVIDYWLKAISTTFHGGYYAYNRQYIEKLPIRTINFGDPQDKSRHDAIVKLVEQMLDAKEKLSNAKTEAETNRFELLCQTLDRQIDEAVYELYRLTPEEIAIVEGVVEKQWLNTTINRL